MTFLQNFFHFPGEKENSLKTDDYGRDLSSVQTLLTKQVSADAAITLWGRDQLNSSTAHKNPCLKYRQGIGKVKEKYNLKYLLFF